MLGSTEEGAQRQERKGGLSQGPTPPSHTTSTLTILGQGHIAGKRLVARCIFFSHRQREWGPTTGLSGTPVSPPPRPFS